MSERNPWLARAGDLPGTNLKDGFEKMTAGQGASVAAAPASSSSAAKPSGPIVDPEAAARAAAQAAAKRALVER